MDPTMRLVTILNFSLPAGPLRGMKRTLTEGGIRVPTLAWWPKTIKSGSVSDEPFYFGDLMASACEMASAEIPKKNNSISFIPTLKSDHKNQELHKYLYWEFYERTFRQAVIMKDWKLIRSGMDNERLELYDLSKDIHEDENLEKLHPDFTKNDQLHGRGTRTTPKLANTEAEEITKHFYTALNFHLSFHV